MASRRGLLTGLCASACAFVLGGKVSVAAVVASRPGPKDPQTYWEMIGRHMLSVYKSDGIMRVTALDTQEVAEYAVDRYEVCLIGKCRHLPLGPRAHHIAYDPTHSYGHWGYRKKHEWWFW